MAYLVSKPFVARGSRVKRCPGCLLSQRVCICGYRVTATARARFVLLMHHNEQFKPTNTGRLIADCLPETRVFEWSRTEPPEAFLALLEDPDLQPYIVFPEGPGCEARMASYQPSQRRPLFIILDGTWRQARRMFRLSRYLQHLPVVQLPELPAQSQYHLRQAVESGQLCTAEVAVQVLEMVKDADAAALLAAYFEVFNEHYRAARLTRPLRDNTPAKQLLARTQERRSALEHKGDGAIIDQADLHICAELAGRQGLV